MDSLHLLNWSLEPHIKETNFIYTKELHIIHKYYFLSSFNFSQVYFVAINWMWQINHEIQTHYCSVCMKYYAYRVLNVLKNTDFVSLIYIIWSKIFIYNADYYEWIFLIFVVICNIILKTTYILITSNLTIHSTLQVYTQSI